MSKVIKAFLVLVILMASILGLSAANAATDESCIHEAIQLSTRTYISDRNGVTFINMREIVYVDSIKSSDNSLRLTFRQEQMTVRVESISSFINKLKRCMSAK